MIIVIVRMTAGGFLTAGGGCNHRRGYNDGESEVIHTLSGFLGVHRMVTTSDQPVYTKTFQDLLTFITFTFTLRLFFSLAPTI